MATKTETTPRKLQILTLTVLGGSFVLQWVLALSAVLQQLQTNQNLSSYYMFFVGQVVVPIVYFAGAFLLNPRKLSKVGRLFESLLIMLVGQVLAQIAVQIAYSMPGVYAQNANQTFTNFIVYDAIAVGIATVVYFAVLVYLRKTKRWK